MSKIYWCTRTCDMCHYTPSKQSLRDMLESPCLSVHLFALCLGHNFLPPCSIWIIFHTIVVHDPRVCHDVNLPWPKVISPRSRSQCTNTQNLCPGHNFSLPCWIKIIFHRFLVYDQRVCHEIYPRSYLTVTGQGHSEQIPKICVWAKTPHHHIGSG